MGRLRSRRASTRRRWVAGGLARGRACAQHVGASARTWTLRVVRRRRLRPRVRRQSRPVGRVAAARGRRQDGWTITPDGEPTRPLTLRADPRPDAHDVDGEHARLGPGRPARSEQAVCLTVEPIVDGVPPASRFPCGVAPPTRPAAPAESHGEPSVPTATSSRSRGSPSSSIRRSPTSPRCASSTGAPRPGRDRRRRALVHDAVRTRLPAHLLDDSCPSTPTLARGVLWHPGRAAGHDRRPSGRGAARQDPPRAPPTRRRRTLRVPRALLRHRRRHAAVRHARRRGVALGRPRTRAISPASAPAVDAALDWMLGPGTATATASSTTSGARRSGCPTRAGRTPGTA